MAISGVLIVGVGLLLFSQARVLWVYYAASLVIASGESLGSSTAYSAALMRWFDQKRGQALGLLASTRGAGYFMVPVLAVLIGAFGWRPTLVVAALVIVGVGLPLSLVLRNRPEPYGYRPDGAAAPATPPGSATSAASSADSLGDGMTVAEALRTPAFYLLGAATAIGGATQISWIVHQVPHLQNVGFTLQGAALITGAYGLFQVPLRFICGWFGDIIGRRRLYVIAYLLQAVGMLIFAWLSPDRMWLLPAYFLTFPFAHAAWGGDVHDADRRLLRHPLLRHDPRPHLDDDDAARLRHAGHRRLGVRRAGQLPARFHRLRADHHQRGRPAAADPPPDLGAARLALTRLRLPVARLARRIAGVRPGA